jgi:hypothetical protein
MRACAQVCCTHREALVVAVQHHARRQPRRRRLRLQLRLRIRIRFRFRMHTRMHISASQAERCCGCVCLRLRRLRGRLPRQRARVQPRAMPHLHRKGTAQKMQRNAMRQTPMRQHSSILRFCRTFTRTPAAAPCPGLASPSQLNPPTRNALRRLSAS